MTDILPLTCPSLLLFMNVYYIFPDADNFFHPLTCNTLSMSWGIWGSVFWFLFLKILLLGRLSEVAV